MAAPVIESKATAANGNSTSPSCSAPAGIVAGELLLAYVNFDGLSADITGGPAGWTKLGGLDPSDVRVGHEIWWKEATGAEPGSYAWSQSASRRTAIGILRISGWDNTGTLKIAVDSAVQASTTTPFSPSITTDIADSLVLSGAASEFGNLSYTPPSGTTEEIDIETGSAGDAGTALGVASEVIATAGATGTRQWTSSFAARFVCSAVAVPSPSASGSGATSFPGAGIASGVGTYPIVSASAAANPGPGSATGQGVAPSVSAGSSAVAAPGDGSAIGQGGAPSISAASNAAPLAGSATGQGVAPIVTTGLSAIAQPGAGSATDAGLAPAVSAGSTVIIAAGSATGASGSPVVQSGATSFPGAGSASGVGYAPNVSAGSAVTAMPGAGSATGAGVAPTVSAGSSVVISAGSATGIGFAPYVGVGEPPSRGRVAFPEDSANSGSVVSNQAAGYVITPNN